jgi:hypothetical protein
MPAYGFTLAADLRLWLSFVANIRHSRVPASMIAQSVRYIDVLPKQVQL